MFVLRMEYVFMNMFTQEKLVLMGSDLITNVYKELLGNRNVRELIRKFDCGGFEQTDDDTLNDLVVHMTRSYCRMRGKDFVRKYMQHGFKNKNLGKGIRPTLAIISNPEVRRALAAAKQKTTTATNVTSTPDDVRVGELNNEEMYTMMEYTCNILQDDDFVNNDEENLFQEALL